MLPAVVLICAGVFSMIASMFDRDPIRWLIVGALSPVIAGFLLAALPAKQNELTPEG